MAEVVTSGFSKYTNNLVDDLTSMHAWLWDCGPEEAVLPDPPEMPSGKDGPAMDLARLQYKRALLAYEQKLLKYEADVIEYQNFQRRYGGPIEIKQWSCDALDSITYDLRAVFEKRQAKPRYYVSKRTSSRLQARIVGSMRETLEREKVELDVTVGLPKGKKPGAGHQANLERQIAGEKEFVQVMKSDPQFGQEMLP